MKEHSEPKTMMQAYWEDGQLYVKNMLAYESMQAFLYYGRKVHENQIDADVQERAVQLALSQADGFEQAGMLAKHVPVPFIGDQELVDQAYELLGNKLEGYEQTSRGIPYRMRRYREILKREATEEAKAEVRTYGTVRVLTTDGYRQMTPAEISEYEVEGGKVQLDKPRE